MLRIVSVRIGAEVSRAELADDGTVTYAGGESAAAAVRRWLRHHSGGTTPGRSEGDAVSGLLADGWSNGSLMVVTEPALPARWTAASTKVRRPPHGGQRAGRHPATLERE
ncbi:hypothetical protein GCM10009530_63660 [Microbispora corallina]|uniref:Uncharacterized protein n=1 Tax=Microbispora corallina TaxID=83302 RepID=A0ABQ4GC35_9ACTN|nr:hypothetical protein Mco01_75890 [Microbispora corallina]